MVSGIRSKIVTENEGPRFLLKIKSISLKFHQNTPENFCMVHTRYLLEYIPEIPKEKEHDLNLNLKNRFQLLTAFIRDLIIDHHGRHMDERISRL